MPDSIRRRLDRLEASVPQMSSAPSGWDGYGVCPPHPLPTADFLAQVVEASIEAGVWTDAELAERVAGVAALGGEVDAELVDAVYRGCSGMSEREIARRERAAAAVDL